MPDRVRSTVRFRALYILLAAVFWYLAGRAHQSISDIVTYAPGVDLAYLPAGVRLILILVLRVWGAVGITIANPALFITEVNRDQFEEVVVNSIICGFVPLLTLYAAERALTIGSNLENISPSKLTLISLAFSISTPVSFTISYYLFGHLESSQILPSLSAMMLGDFVGCLAVVAISFGAIKIYRISRS